MILLSLAILNFSVVTSYGQAIDKFLDKVEKASDNLDKTLNSVDKLLNELDKATDKNSKKNNKKPNNDKKEKANKIVDNKKIKEDKKNVQSKSDSYTDLKKNNYDSDLKPLFLTSDTWRGLSGWYECEFKKSSMQYFEKLKIELYMYSSEDFPIYGGSSNFKLRSGTSKRNDISFQLHGQDDNSKRLVLYFTGNFFETDEYYVITGDCEERNLRKEIIRSSKLILKLLKVDDKVNVFNPKMNEDEYFNRIIKHYGNFYTTQTSFDETGVKITVNKRDINGFPSLVTGSYLRKDVKTLNRIVVQFNEGIPYRATYPDINFIDGVSANGEGKSGRLQFSLLNRNKIDKFFNGDLVEFKKVDLVNQEKLLNEVIKKQSIYGNFDCSKCLVGVKDNSSTKYGETIYDEKNRPIGVEEKSTGTTYGIRYTNKCNQTITVCAIRKSVENNGVSIFYEDVSIILKPFQSRKETQSILNTGPFGEKVADYFNLNPNYNVKSAQPRETQYIKIVGKEKAKL